MLFDGVRSKKSTDVKLIDILLVIGVNETHYDNTTNTSIALKQALARCYWTKTLDVR